MVEGVPSGGRGPLEKKGGRGLGDGRGSRSLLPMQMGRGGRGREGGG